MTTTVRSTLDWREYWREQAKIDGTDWPSLGLTATRAFWHLGLASSFAWGSSS